MDEVFTYPCKVKDSPFKWIGDPDGGVDDSDADNLLKLRRDDLVVWGGADDPDASYSYDETALVSYDTDFYVVQTAGCSCPSPSETWGTSVVGSLGKIILWFTNGSYQGYTFPPYAKTEIEKAIRLAGRMVYEP
jgi:hypothetical protein